jgi:hypothetical protein
MDEGKPRKTSVTIDGISNNGHKRFRFSKYARFNVQHTVTCFNVTIDEIKFEIAFIDHFNTRRLNTFHYSAIAHLHTLQISVAHTRIFQSAVSSPVVP